MMQNVLKEIFIRRPEVDLIGIANGGLSAVTMIKHQSPDLVVIDSNIPVSEASQLIQITKDELEQVRTLVLVETTQQLKRATDLGADLTLRTYTLADKLDMLLSQLRSE
jgi:chemotaxis response regulator CheB